ncbi:MAG: ornithine carbamoyltransferase [Acidobacteriota bacterium]
MIEPGFQTPSPTSRLAKNHLLGLADLSGHEIRSLIELGLRVKADGATFSQKLEGKILAMLFEKPSLRTRATFEIAMLQLGGRALYLGPQEAGLGKRESVPDVARNLSRWVDGVMARVFAHQSLVELAAWGSIPVINGLCDFEHPCQALGDFLTFQEHKGKLTGRRLAWVGDGNNVAHSLIFGAARLGLSMRVATPEGYEPDREVVEKARAWGGDLMLTRDPREAVEGADAVYTDVWASMGQEQEAEERARVFRPFQVNRALMDQAGSKALFMHCLPAHRGEEVSDEVIDSPRSIVFDQAENRLHVQKAILLTLLS